MGDGNGHKLKRNGCGMAMFAGGDIEHCRNENKEIDAVLKHRKHQYAGMEVNV